MEKTIERIDARLDEVSDYDMDDAARQAVATVIAEEIDRLRRELRRELGCQRCEATGTITDRRGDLDECPECHGKGVPR